MAIITLKRETDGILLTLEDVSGRAFISLTDEERVNLAFALLELSE